MVAKTETKIKQAVKAAEASGLVVAVIEVCGRGLHGVAPSSKSPMTTKAWRVGGVVTQRIANPYRNPTISTPPCVANPLNISETHRECVAAPTKGGA